MRNMEFLPSWYSVVRRQRIAVIVQAWATVALLLTLLVTTGVAKYRLISSRGELAGVKKEMAVTQKDLDELDSMLQVQRRWTEQGQVLAKLGVSVESTRLMSLLAQATPESVALIGLNLQTEEKAEPVRTISAARAMKEPLIDRKLRVRVQGVAPSDAEVADLMAKLGAVVFLDDVSMSYSKDADQNGRAVRQFEVTFAMDLNAPGSN
ncbi:hypothetical protein BH10PLA1_BH10PLA1_02590 [soil metagenome]